MNAPAAGERDAGRRRQWLRATIDHRARAEDRSPSHTFAPPLQPLVPSPIDRLYVLTREPMIRGASEPEAAKNVLVVAR